MSLEVKINKVVEFLALEKSSAVMEKLDKVESRYIKDLKVSLSTALLQAEELSEREAYAIALSVAVVERNESLINGFTSKFKEEGGTDEELAEVISCTSLLSANNVLYRFRHFTEKETYQKQPAKIRMGIMMRPILGKEFFELLSLAVSAVNGCELCVKSHEESLINLGTSEKRVWESIRIASVVNSLSKLF